MSKLKSCKSCDKEIAKSAKSCPNCGASQKGSLIIKLGKGLFVLVVAGSLFNVVVEVGDGKKGFPGCNDSRVTSELETLLEQNKTMKGLLALMELTMPHEVTQVEYIIIGAKNISTNKETGTHQCKARVQLFRYENESMPFKYTIEKTDDKKQYQIKVFDLTLI
ncbi:MAG: hypothetical protein COA74_11085 [Gammaproteobacteria bacterium]|nr:MAG: hypothetical protein COA74_11085 [Gammaproteobacteria bacterium]